MFYALNQTNAAYAQLAVNVINDTFSAKMVCHITVSTNNLGLMILN